MHHIYHTEAIILGSKNSGDAGKVFFLFTRELGMVYASASGVRKLESKLRYILQDYARINVDLVRGKDMWRLTSASKVADGINWDYTSRSMGVVANVSRLLKKLLAGEEANRELFDDLSSGLQKLSEYDKKENIEDLEMLIVLRALYHLGYIGDHEEVEGLATSPMVGELVYEVNKNRSSVLREINRAIRESHL